MDDGKKYVIKNSPYKNLFGGGNQKVIEEKADTSWFFELPWLSKIFAALFLLSCVFLLTSIATFELLKIALCFLVSAGLGVGFIVVTFGRPGFYKDAFVAGLQILGYILLGIGAMILIPVVLVWIMNTVFSWLS